jgi:hypothetical protein
VDLLEVLLDWVRGSELEEIAERHLGQISDEDYRAEALSEFTSSVFEHHLPWFVGTLIGWLNTDREAADSSPVVPTDIASHVHYGVDTATALEAMRGGVRSKRLAQQIAQYFGPDADDLPSQVAELGLAGWREHLGEFPSEIRDLLRFVRRRPHLVSDVLDGESVAVRVVGGPSTASGDAALSEDATQPEPRPLQVHVDGELQGVVTPDAHEALVQVMELGFPLRWRYDHTTGHLSISLESES